MSETEKVFFDKDGILVTNRRVMVRGDMIPISAIASVNTYAIKQKHKGPMIFYALTPLFAIAGSWVIAIICAGAGAAWQYLQIKNRKYVLAIRSVAGDGKELTGPDVNLFSQVAIAINEVIASD